MPLHRRRLLQPQQVHQEQCLLRRSLQLHRPVRPLCQGGVQGTHVRLRRLCLPWRRLLLDWPLLCRQLLHRRVQLCGLSRLQAGSEGQMLRRRRPLLVRRQRLLRHWKVH